METIDEEITKASLDYLDRAKQANRPFFLWWNSTRKGGKATLNVNGKPVAEGRVEKTPAGSTK